MKLWDKGYSIDTAIEKFTVGNDRELDMKLAEYDVLGNMAHARMLHSIGILSTDEVRDLLGELQNILGEIENGEFQIEAEFEDVHSKVEHLLTERVGEAGKKIHTARSRNDQVLVDLHLYAKAQLAEIQAEMKELFDLLLSLSEKHKDVLLPGYTHLQVAMPSSFGLWFSAYAESLVDDLSLVNAAYRVSDQNPLGSAAGYGSSFPINRTMTTQELGFADLKYNVVAAQMSRGKLEKTVSYALASVAGTLGKLADDVCLYMSQNFDFIGFPKELTTGSSIMPHKQNPDVFELVRAVSNEIQSLPVQLTMLTNNMTSGYHRDYQRLKGPFMQGIDQLHEIIAITHHMLENIIVKPSVVADSKYDFLFSVDTLNERVINGQSFREAYRDLGAEIANGTYQPKREVKHTHEGSLGNLCLEQIRAKWEREARM